MTNLIRASILFAAFVAAPATAEPLSNSDRIIVRTADLNLATASGQRLLERRLSDAIVEACGVASDADLAGGNDVRRCRDKTRARVAADRKRLVDLASGSRSIVIAAR